MKRTNCRGCRSHQIRLVYDYGLQPLAGNFPLKPENEEPAERYPLDLSQCKKCGLLQVTNLPPVESVFHDNYRYSSSTIPALTRHFNEYADWLAQRLPSGATVLEFGCNDGILLSFLCKKGISCVGIDASDNVAELARKKGLKVYTGFMTTALIEEHRLQGKHDLVTCSNVFAHIDDLQSTLSAVRSSLKPNGLFVVEVHDADALIRETQFETVYHEHLTYFTERTLRRLLEVEGFRFVECSRTLMHGGALRIITKLEGKYHEPPPDINRSELICGNTFKEAIERCIADIRNARREYGQLDGFGAAGRAQMFVNITNTADCFRQVFDDSTLRQNRYIVGTNIPIRGFEEPVGDACLILAWNYAKDISVRIKNYYKFTFTVLPKKVQW